MARIIPLKIWGAVSKFCRARVVEKVPARRSTIGDICFETDWVGLDNQFRGGLKAGDIRALPFASEVVSQHVPSPRSRCRRPPGYRQP